MHLEVYTDGAFSPLSKEGGIGIVFILDGKVIKKYSKKFEHTTNNRMEISAVLIALQSIKGNVDKITLYSDSQYVICCAKGEFGRTKNADLWKLFDIAVSKIKCPIEYIWIHGHQGNQYNELADSLAVSARQAIDL